ncbi:DHBP synthase RibB-like alpha/beta domain-containing protein [Xylariomycetidae sp. FL2044]|nr:DHBP synthase RibB-like alpha/beta domain-containing protein [Xylariomycetidae sp. FL2044]
MSQDLPSDVARMSTRIIKVTGQELGKFKQGAEQERLGTWEISSTQSSNLKVLEDAASRLRNQDTPVAFPTETVYGLGADATRSSAVRGIYTAKARPSDNPLIIHVSDLDMLRGILKPASNVNGSSNTQHDQIPEIYKPLIEKFWPGPLTMLFPNPNPSKLAPEVTAGLQSFGVRMPSSPLALTLIKLVGSPLAAPSANASTKPSPTTAEHVLEDLDGRIEIIIDGGPCQVGVESTVVDGMSSPPVVLRPGGIGIDELRNCPGWEKVEKGYKDQSELGKTAPRAPGMKYKHYSPKAKVVLYEASFTNGSDSIPQQDVEAYCLDGPAEQRDGTSKATLKIGIIRTRNWKPAGGLRCGEFRKRETVNGGAAAQEHQGDILLDVQEADLYDTTGETRAGEVMDIGIGRDTRSIAQGLFSALRELDRRGADIIFVEGTVDDEDIGAAVMNRLRKAASEIKSS